MMVEVVSDIEGNQYVALTKGLYQKTIRVGSLGGVQYVFIRVGRQIDKGHALLPELMGKIDTCELSSQKDVQQYQVGSFFFDYFQCFGYRCCNGTHMVACPLQYHLQVVGFNKLVFYNENT